jgi:hypothetical protein
MAARGKALKTHQSRVTHQEDEVRAIDCPSGHRFGGAEVALCEARRELARGGVGADGRWSGLHDLFGAQLRIAVQRATAQAPEQHAAGVVTSAKP